MILKERISTVVLSVICLALLAGLLLAVFSNATEAGVAYRNEMRDCDSIKTAKIAALSDTVTMLREELSRK